MKQEMYYPSRSPRTKIKKDSTLDDLWNLTLTPSERKRVMRACDVHPINVLVATPWEEIINALRLKMLPMLARELKRRKLKAGVTEFKFCAHCVILFSDEFPQYKKTGVCAPCFTGEPFASSRVDGLHRGDFMEALSVGARWE